MKRLNNKGFTLIELLAVIVILAIIMVVTIPTVLSSMDNARKSTLQNSANTIAEWVEKESALFELGMADSAFSDVCTGGCKSGQSRGGCTDTVSVWRKSPLTYKKDYYSAGKPNENLTNAGNYQKDVDFLKAAGVDPNNYACLAIKMVNGRACVALVSAASNGDFNSKFDQVSAKVAWSTGCTAENKTRADAPFKYHSDWQDLS